VDNVDLKGKDIHVVAGILKAFFKDLPDPIFTYEAYDELTKIPRGTKKILNTILEISVHVVARRPR
jgi:hypothetical protein